MEIRHNIFDTRFKDDLEYYIELRKKQQQGQTRNAKKTYQSAAESIANVGVLPRETRDNLLEALTLV